MRRRSSRGSVPACRQLAVHIARRELAGLFEEHAKQHARFEGRGSARDGCGSRGDGAEAVAVAACARSRAGQSSRAPWRPARRRTTGRSKCSQLPSILPGAFAFTSSRTARGVYSATVLGGLSQLRALHEASRRSELSFSACRQRAVHIVSSRVSTRSTRSSTPLRGERLGARWLWLAPRRCGRRGDRRVCAPCARCVAGSPRAPWRPARTCATARSRCSHLPSILPGEFAFTSSRTARDVCSATVFGGLSQLRALHEASQLSGLRARMSSARGSHRAPRARGSVRGAREAARRFEGRGSARDGCGSRRDGADAVAIAASALDPEVGSRAERRGSRHVGARLGGRSARTSPRSCRDAFAFTSSRTARDVCSATVFGGLSRLRALHQAHAGALIARRGARADASLAAHAPHVRPRVRVSRRLSRDRW
jgi:hypothetical protein